MKRMSGALEKQQRMLRLLLRKMDIEEDEADDDADGDQPEADDCDDIHAEVKGHESRSSSAAGSGWSSRLLRHTLVKQAMVIAKWKQQNTMMAPDDLTDVN